MPQGAVFIPPEEYERRQWEQQQQQLQEREQQQQFQEREQQQQFQEREKNQVEHSSYTRTDIRAPMINMPTPFISSTIGAQDLIGEGFQASVSRITGGSEEMRIEDYPQLIEEAKRDEDAKYREQQLMNQQFEKELDRKTEAYRKTQEAETEWIRKELEKQHLRDVEFRKELMEQAIENQKRQIDLEARYAKKELDRERTKARMALEKSKFHTDIQVNMESAAGLSQSGGQVVSQSERVTQNVRKA